MSASRFHPQSRIEVQSLPDGWRCIRLGRLIGDAQSGFACGKRVDQTLSFAAGKAAFTAKGLADGIGCHVYGEGVVFVLLTQQ